MDPNTPPPFDRSRESRLLKASEAAELLNVSERWISDGKALRYRSSRVEASYDASSFESAFLARTNQMALDLDDTKLGPVERKIWRGDSRRKLKQTDELPFRLCITSPPYLNSFDYTDVYRPELFLGGFVSSAEELRELRLRTVRSHVQASWKKPQLSTFGEHFTSAWRAISERSDELWDLRIPDMIQAYFEDMTTVLTELHRLARNDGSLWMVVSTSAYAGVHVPVDLILADVGTQAGWHLRELVVLRNLRSSGQQWKALNSGNGTEANAPALRESVVVFDARGPRVR